MANFSGVELQGIAGADLSADRYLWMTLDGSQRFVRATSSTDRDVRGILGNEDAAAANDDAWVTASGIAKSRFGGTVAPWGKVMTNGVGRSIAHVAGNVALGIYIPKKARGSILSAANNQLRDVLVLPQPEADTIVGAATLDYGSIGANGGEAKLTATVTGAKVGDQANCSAVALEAGLVVGNVYVSALNTITLTLNNPTHAVINPASQSFIFSVIPQ